MNDLSKILTPEESLLLDICRLNFTHDQYIELRNKIQKIKDWPGFINLAQEHGIIALCWYNITKTGNNSIVANEYLSTLYKGYLTSLSRNSFIYNLLNEVLKLAEEENIKIVLLKGLALEKTIYLDQGIRQMNDLDILVPKNLAIQLRKKLLQNGFESDPMISPLHEIILPTYGKHLPEMHKNGFSVEIHFNLFDQKSNSLSEELLDNSSSNIFNLPNVFVPEVQLHFLYLIEHLHRHENEGSSQLRLYADLVIILSSHAEEILNNKLFEIAEVAGIKCALNEILYILSYFWDFNFKPISVDYLIDIDRNVIIERFLKFLRKPKENQPGKKTESILKPLSSINGMYNKLLFFLGYLVPSISFIMFRYKLKYKLSAIFYYPVRWVKFCKTQFMGKI
jgi:hypothetical protein